MASTRAPPEDGERPSKRTKISSDDVALSSNVIEETNDDEEDSEEEISQEPTEVRASDLYLDTASAFQCLRVD